LPEVKVSDLIADVLAAQGVTHVYELIGGMIVHIVDSIHQAGRIELVSMRHEQAAAFAADAAGRCLGVPGVAMGTSGPGATNLLTGIGSCYLDSSPAVFITGQVNRHEQKGDRAIRQLGFQETDIVTMAAPITKAAVRVGSPEEVAGALASAFALAVEGRPGPVLLDIPMDVQGSFVEAPEVAPPARREPAQPDPEALDDLLRDLAAAERPLILVGAGVRAAARTDQLGALAESLGVPVVNSLLAVDALAHEHPLRVGLIGSYGNRWANMAIGRADFMLVLGSRLDIRQTGSEVDAFKGDRVVHHVDTDPAEINNRVLGCHEIVADLRDFLPAAIERASAHSVPDFTAWAQEIADLRAEWPDTAELPDIEGINPNAFMHELSAAASQATAYAIDVGQHQQWAAQSLELGPGQRFLTSGGMGAMGFGLPAAIGAVLTLGGPVVMVAGDGSFQLNIQELQTVAQHRLPVKMIVLDNRCHGMVRQFQESYFEERYQSTLWGYSAPDFARVAAAYEIDSLAIDDPEEVEGGLEALWRDPEEPFLLQVMIDPMANAYPKLAFGRPMTEMEPLAKPIAMKGATAPVAMEGT
jgi:acetolactate synthase-1/2/3 large subunit